MTLFDLAEQKVARGDSRFQQSSVSVSLKSISVDRLSAFMESVENSTRDGLVKITRLNVKTNFESSDLLHVKMTVATWKAV